MIDGLKRYPVMKESAVPWLGRVPSHWEVRRLGSLGSFSASGIDKKTAEGEPLVRMVNYLDIFRNATHTLVNDRNYMIVSCPEWKRRVHDIRAGDMVFTPSSETVEDIGCSAVAVQDIENGVYSYHVIRFRPSEPMALSFQRYWCNSAGVLGQFSAACKGTTRQILTRGDFRSTWVAVPPPTEQVLIGRFLDHIDRRIRHYIRAKQKLIKLLEEQKQAIIHNAVTRGLDPNVRLKPSGVEWLGDVPEHWEVKPLKFLVPEVTVGIVIQPARLYVSSGVPCLRSLNVSSGVIDDRRLVFISPESNYAHRKSQIFSGDIVVVRTGRAGVAAIVTPQFDAANCIDLLIVRASDRLDSFYLLRYLNSWAARSIVQYSSVGAIQAHYNTNTLANLIVPAPPLEEQLTILAAITKQTALLEKGKAVAEKEIGLLREYRTGLVADVVTGKLDVREAAARLPDEVEGPEPFDEVEAEGRAEEAGGEDTDEVPEAAVA